MVLLPAPAFCKTWRVQAVKAEGLIRKTILQASAGDTILVDKGIYLEKDLLIDKPLVLQGMNGPVLDGESQYEIVAVKSDHVILDGFHLCHSGYSGWNDIAAVRLYNVKEVSILNNTLDDTFFGIFCQNCDNCIIKNNQLTSTADVKIESGNGIHCWHCNGMQIIGNRITRHRDGIYFEFVTNSLIQDNHSFHNVRYGLHFMFSHNDRYEENTFEHNEAGVSVMFSHGVDMRGNTFEDNLGGGAFGILLKEISDSRIHGNHFSRNTIGIYMEGTTRVAVIANTFSGNGWALKVQASCSSDTITHNNFKANTFDIATNGTLVLNDYDGNYWDKYEGYDLNRDGIGDIPYHPVSLYAMVAEKNPTAMMLFHSFMVTLLDRTERVIPAVTPINLVDHHPYMKPFAP